MLLIPLEADITIGAVTGVSEGAVGAGEYEDASSEGIVGEGEIAGWEVKAGGMEWITGAKARGVACGAALDTTLSVTGVRGDTRHDISSTSSILRRRRIGDGKTGGGGTSVDGASLVTEQVACFFGGMGIRDCLGARLRDSVTRSRTVCALGWKYFEIVGFGRGGQKTY